MEADPTFKHNHILVTPGKSFRRYIESRNDPQRLLIAGTFLESVLFLIVNGG